MSEQQKSFQTCTAVQIQSDATFHTLNVQEQKCLHKLRRKIDRKYERFTATLLMFCALLSGGAGFTPITARLSQLCWGKLFHLSVLLTLT